MINEKSEIENDRNDGESTAGDQTRAIDEAADDRVLRVVERKLAEESKALIDQLTEENHRFFWEKKALSEENAKLQDALATRGWGKDVATTQRLSLLKAEPVPGQVIPDVLIAVRARVVSDQPDPEDHRRDYRRRYDLDAETLATTLRDALPGGTIDRLVAHLLLAKASDLRVTVGVVGRPSARSGEDECRSESAPKMSPNEKIRLGMTELRSSLLSIQSDDDPRRDELRAQAKYEIRSIARWAEDLLAEFKLQ